MAKLVERLEFHGADDARDFIDNLSYDRVPSPQEEADLLASLPPADETAPIMVVRSVRVPLELDQRVRAAAEADGVSPSEFIRNALAAAIAGRDRSNLVNLDDVIRAIRSVPHAA